MQRLSLLSMLALMTALTRCACPQAGAPCETIADCLQNEVCFEQQCRRVCNVSSECAEGEECIQGACLPGQGGGGRDAARVDGAVLDSARTDTGTTDTRTTDTRTTDEGGMDAGMTDAGGTDAGEPDTGSTDAGMTDAGGTDDGEPDTGSTDAGGTDAGGRDAGTTDSAAPDSGMPDSSQPDSSLPDSSLPDSSQPDGSISVAPVLGGGFPRIAQEGDTIELHGQFPDLPLSVTFPMAPVAISATRVNQGRAEVVVPTGAGAGMTTVLVDGRAIGAFYFRATTFKLGLAEFGPPPQSPIAVYEPSLPQATTGAVVLATSRYLYVIGGGPGISGASYDEAYRARIHADGTLGLFERDDAISLVTARRNAPHVRIGNTLYIFGGTTGNIPLDTIEKSVINLDGSLTDFSLVSAGTLSSPREFTSAVVVGRYVYLIGGGYERTVDRAPITHTAAIGTFENVGELISPRAEPAVFSRGGWLHVIGGKSSLTDALSSRERAPINPDGTLGAFEDVSGGDLPASRGHIRAHVLGDSVFVLGGFDALSGSDDGYLAPIQPDGTLGTFVAEDRKLWKGPRASYGSAIVGNNLYLVGGRDGLSAVDTVERASISEATTLIGDFSEAGFSINAGRAYPGSAVVGDYLYVYGGRSSTSPSTTIEHAPIFPDGSIGEFSVVADMGYVLADPCMARIGSTVHLLGGGRDATNYIDDALVITHDAEGEIVSQTTHAGFLPANRAMSECLILGERLFMLGGRAPADTATIITADIQGDHSLSAFRTSGHSLALPRRHAGVAVNRDSVFYYGGSSSAGQHAEIQRATWNLSAGIDQDFVHDGDLPSSRNSYAMTSFGAGVFLIGGRLDATTHHPGTAYSDALGTHPYARLLDGSPDVIRLKRGGRAAQLGNYIYLFGGWDETEDITEVEVLEVR